METLIPMQVYFAESRYMPGAIAIMVDIAPDYDAYDPDGEASCFWYECMN